MKKTIAIILFLISSGMADIAHAADKPKETTCKGGNENMCPISRLRKPVFLSIGKNIYDDHGQLKFDIHKPGVRENLELSSADAALLHDTRPIGVILLARNCDRLPQIKKLIADIKKASGNPNLLIAADIEGGAVNRLQRAGLKLPAPGAFGALLEQYLAAGMGRQEALKKAKSAVYLQYRIIGEAARKCGINTVFAPVTDVRHEGSNDIIGSRAFSNDPDEVAVFAKEAIRALGDEHVIACPKHWPGYGRAVSDSHVSLPTINAAEADLAKSDFKVIKKVAPHVNMAMTAHIVVPFIDEKNPVTLSSKGISYMRDHFDARHVFIVSDDMQMGALKGIPLKDKVQQALAAGCDAVLIGHGSIEEKREAIEAAPDLTPAAMKRLESARSVLKGVLKKEDMAADWVDPHLLSRLRELMGPLYVAQAEEKDPTEYRMPEIAQ